VSTAGTLDAGSIAGDVFALVPVADQRHALLAEVAPVLTGFLLHDWRDAVRGNDPSELILLWVLQAGAVGDHEPGLAVDDELDARLARWPRRPTDIEAGTISGLVGAASRALQRSPGTEQAARRLVRYRTLASGPGGWPGRDLRRAVEGHAGDPASPWEVLPVLLDDAARIVAGDRSPATLRAATEHLEGAEIFVGRLVPIEQPGWSPAGPALRAAIDAERWDEFWPLFTDRQRQTIGLLLRGAAVPEPPPSDGWMSWAEAAPERSRARFDRQQLLRIAYVVVVLVVGAILAVAPHRIPGRLPERRLTPGAGPTVAGVSLHRADRRTYVNVAFQSKPQSLAFVLSFDDTPTQITFVQEGSSDRWQVGIDPSDRRLHDVTVESSGTRVVVGLPGSFDPRGVAVSTADGGRAPAQGFSVRLAPPGAYFNLVDLIVLVALAYAAWRGWRLGAAGGLPALVVYLVTAVLTRILYSPLAHALHGMFHVSWRVADALSFGFLFVVVGLLLQREARRRLQRVLTQLIRGHQLARTADGVLGALVRIVDVLVVMSVALTVVADLAALGGAAAAVDSSFLGRALVSFMRTAFGGL
jgi:hypothetical protein